MGSEGQELGSMFRNNSELAKVKSVLMIEALINTTNMERKEYTRVLNDAVKKNDEDIIKSQASGKILCARIFGEEYGKTNI